MNISEKIKTLKMTRKLIKKHLNIFRDIFGQKFKIELHDDNVILESESGDKYTIYSEEGNFCLSSEGNKFTFYIPSTRSDTIEVKEYKTLKLNEYTETDIITRKYKKSKAIKPNDELISIEEISYIIKNNSNEICPIKTTFSIQREMPIEKNIIHIYLDDEDISNKFLVLGWRNDKYAIILDIYNGNINKRNYDYLNENAENYGLKYLTLCKKINITIDELENENTLIADIDKEISEKLIRKKFGYQGHYDSNKVSSIIKMFNYKMSAIETIRAANENDFGMPDKELMKLSAFEEQALIKEYHKKHPVTKSDKTYVIYGSGDYAIFIKEPVGKKVFTNGISYIAGKKPGESLEEAMKTIKGWKPNTRRLKK